jgi:hypothetical protein
MTRCPLSLAGLVLVLVACDPAEAAPDAGTPPDATHLRSALRAGP